MDSQPVSRLRPTASQARCEALAVKGTGYGTCDRPLGAHGGGCDRASSHVEAPTGLTDGKA